MPDRRSVRLRSHAYAGGLYFVTVCTAGRRRLFGGVADGAMRLSSAGRIARDGWVRTGSVRRDTVRLDAFVVMPDHVHVLFGIVPVGVAGAFGVADAPGRGVLQHATPTGARPFTSSSGDVAAAIRGYKSAVTRAVRAAHGRTAGAVWQRGYHDRVVRTRREADAVRRYIAQNPARWRG